MPPAGLLTGRPATTHWGALDLLAELDGTVDVRPTNRFAGEERAREVRKGIQYDPAPPV